MIFAFLLILLSIAGGTTLTLPFVRRTPLLERVAIGIPVGMALSGFAGILLSGMFGANTVTEIGGACAAALPLLVLCSRSVRQRFRHEVRVMAGRTIFKRRPQSEPMEIRQVHSLPKGRPSPNKAKQSGGKASRPNRNAPTGRAALALPPTRTAKGMNVARIGILVWYLCLAALLFFFFRAAGISDGAGAIKTANAANYGDLPFHIAIVQGFVRGDNFPPEHPEFAGARLTYPFLVDFVAAQYVAVGAKVLSAFLLQNLLLIFSLVVLIHRFVRRATGGDTLAAHLVIPILLFSGGWGWTHLTGDFRASGGDILNFLRHLPHNYTQFGQNYRWGNVLLVLLGTQRSILLGIPLAFTVWNLWWEALRRDSEHSNAIAYRSMLFAGLAAGSLPLAHFHTFLVLLAVGGWQAVASPRHWRRWLLFFAVSLGLAAPQLAFMLTGSQTRAGQFAQVYFGWDSHANYLSDWLWFWMANTGVVFLLLPAALRRIPDRLCSFYIPFIFLCFLAPNCMKFAPWVWDNVKILAYWYFATAVVLACFLSQLWRRGTVWRLCVVPLVFLLTVSGVLDVWRVASWSETLTIFTANGIAFGDAVARMTPPRAVILTAPTHDHPVYWSGRRVLTGYGGHLFSHGIDYAQRDADMRRIYAGAANADALLKQYNVSYIAIGPQERDQVKNVNDTYLAHFPVVATEGGYELRQVLSPAKEKNP